MPNKKFHVAYITDENYAMPTCVSIISLLENKASDISYCVHVILDDVTEKSKNHFKKINYKNCEIDLIDVDNSFYQDIKDGSLKENAYVTSTALLKFNLPYIFKELDTLLYIDGDIIISQDISELFEIDISKYCLAAVESMAQILYPAILHKTMRYFNSGFMLFNLNKMRLDNITEQLIEYKKNGINFNMDNDALSVVLEKKTLFLPFKYNFSIASFMFNDFSEVNEKLFSNTYTDEYDCLKDQKVFHSQSKFKPWKVWLPWSSELFLRYYDMSPYKNEPLKLKSPFPAIEESKKETIKNINAVKEWRFPLEKITKGKKIILYGAGEVGKAFWRFLQYTDYSKVVLWVDKNYKKINQDNDSVESIYAPEDIKKCQNYDYVLISMFRKPMIDVVVSYLKSIGVPENKIVTV